MLSIQWDFRVLEGKINHIIPFHYAPRGYSRWQGVYFKFCEGLYTDVGPNYMICVKKFSPKLKSVYDENLCTPKYMMKGPSY